MLGLGPRCRRFESFRPDQKIQTVAFAAVLIFCLERTDSNGKLKFTKVRTFHSIYHQKVINLWGIPDNLPAFGTWQIYSLSPRPEINKNTALVMRYFYLQNLAEIKNSLILVANVFIRRFVLWGIMVIIECL